MSNYTKEFKLEAIRLLESKKVAGTDLARELGCQKGNALSMAGRVPC